MGVEISLASISVNSLAQMGTATHFFLHSPTLATSPPIPRLTRTLSFRPKSTHFLPSPRSLPTITLTRLSLRPNHKHLACSLSDHQNPLSKSLPKPFSSIDLSTITPLTVCKWSAVLSLAVAAAKKTASLLLNPFFWTYFSWTWVFWPWIVAVLLAGYGLYCARKHSLGRANIFEQLAVVTSAVAWLTLVPPAHFNGFLEGWPIALFFVYLYFFFFESTVRRRLYGDLYPRAHDPKWDVQLPSPFRACFAIFVLIAHWLAAYEGPELQLISGGWANVGTWVLIAMALFMRYHSILYLAKYSEKVAVPTAVVQFGPYRWVRHPIYASTMLLFALHCITLRAPLSLLFLVAVCLLYYGRKAELEEALMVETFGEKYTEYMNKVRYKLIPLLF